MDDNRKVTNIFQKYGGASSSEALVSTAITERKAYRAVDTDRTGQAVMRIRIHFSDGGISVPGYAFLSNILSASDERLALIFSSGGIVIKGRNLRKLLDDLQQHRVTAAYAFDPAQHLEPDAGDAFIRFMIFAPPGAKNEDIENELRRLEAEQGQ